MTTGMNAAPAILANSTSNSIRSALNDNVLVHNETIKTCIHEAAHTVAARFNGFPVKWVSIDPNFIRTDPIAVDTENSDSAALCMAIASPWLAPILDRGRLTTKAEKELVSAYGAQVMAGPIAEQLFDPSSYDIATAGGDHSQLNYVLSLVEKRKFERQKMLRNILKATAAFVGENRVAIARIAKKLQGQRTIFEAEINALLAEFGIGFDRAAA